MNDECYSVLLEADTMEGVYICVSVDRRGKVKHEFYLEDGEAYSALNQKPGNPKISDDPTCQSAYAGIFE
jgi:hypothetical protein